jgi:GT2 family glycosyltransferase
MRQISVIILAYRDEPWLAQSVAAVLGSRDVDIEVILVDNGSSSISDVATHPRLRILTPGTNTGFAGGCNTAASHASFDTLIFVNSDLIVREDAIALLSARLDGDDVGLATGAVLLPGEPLTVNSIGNPIHFLMFSWAGAFGEPFVAHDAQEKVAGVSGAFFACSREHWDRLGGFDDTFFAYAEDADISLRTWQAGKTVVFEPRAIGVHHYQFTKNNAKWFLLERNRLINFFTLYERSSVWLLLPIFVPVELGVLASAMRGGWAREKLASWHWLWVHRSYLRQRRSFASASKVTPIAGWTRVVSGEMHIPNEFGLHVPTPVNWVLGRYWRLVRGRVA